MLGGREMSGRMLEGACRDERGQRSGKYKALRHIVAIQGLILYFGRHIGFFFGYAFLPLS